MIILPLGARRFFLLALGHALFGFAPHGFHVAVHGAAQVLHQLLQLLRRGALSQGALQRLAGGFEFGAGIGEIAFLNAQRRLPEKIDGLFHIAVVAHIAVCAK